MTDAERVFRRQVEAFNAHDLDAFLDTYDADAVVRGEDPSAVLRGRAEMIRHYRMRLAQPGLWCDVLSTTTVAERWVVAHERVSNDAGVTELLAVFDVRNGVIAASASLPA